MSAIEKRIAEWTTRGIIDEPTAGRIREYERTREGAGWVMYGVVGLGLLVLVSGIISVVAANWQYISNTQKIVGYFLLQSLLGFAVVRTANFPGIRKESFLTLAGLFVLAGIALIGQIFHLESDGWQGLLMWIVLIFPLMYLVESRLLNHCWLFGFMGVVTFWCDAHSYLLEQYPVTVFFSIIAIAYVWIALGLARNNLPIPKRLADTGKWWAIFLLLTAVTPFANAMHYTNEVQHIPEALQQGILIGVAALLLVFVALRFSKPILPERTQVGYGLFLSMILASLLIPFSVRSQVLGCFIFVATWAVAAGVAASLGKKRLFDLATLVIAVRLITVYFEVFGSLLATGFGLIAAGLVILGVSMVWHRYRHVLAGLLSGGQKL